MYASDALQKLSERMVPSNRVPIENRIGYQRLRAPMGHESVALIFDCNQSV